MSASTEFPRPAGHHVVTPGFVVPKATAVIAFLERAFGGTVTDRYDGPDGVVHHAEVMLGDSVVMLGDAIDRPPMPASLSFYVDNGDAVNVTYRRALDAGATSISEPTNQPWGYRTACVRDPGGNHWTICAIVEQVTRDEILARMQKQAAAQ